MSKGRSPEPAKNLRRANPGRVCRTCFYLESAGDDEFLCTRPGEIVFDCEVDTLLYVCDGFRYTDDVTDRDDTRSETVSVGELRPFLKSLKDSIQVVAMVRITSHDTDEIPFRVTDVDFHPDPGMVWVTMQSLPSVPVPKRYKKRRVACDKKMKVTLVHQD